MTVPSGVSVFYEIFFFGLGGPIVAIRVWTYYRLKKGRRALKNGKLTGEPPVPRFDPKPEPAPGTLLRHFNSPQRSYLRGQGRWGRLEYLVGSWVLFVMFCENLPPQMADSYDMALSLPQSVWYTYLHVGFSFGLTMCGFAAAVFAAVAVRRKSRRLEFERTRPLTLRFLFWSRTGLALAALLAAIATAALGFFLLLRIFYGPVWNHVPSTIAAPGITWQQAQHVISTLQTSPLPLVLSHLTTSTLIFSLVVAVRSLPWGFTPSSNSKFATTLVVVYWTSGAILLIFFVLWGTGSLQPARVLFLYNHRDVGPPPYACALIPIMIAAVLLTLAQFSYARNEIS
jgi:hypothetical protein